MSTASLLKQRFTLQERLACGNFTLDEVCALKPCSRTTLYADAHAGLVRIEKHGSRAFIRGPVARAYIAGEPIPEAA